MLQMIFTTGEPLTRAVFSAAGPFELDDLEVARQLAQTCYELYRRVPAGLAPEIAFFLPPRVPWPKAHPADIGGGDFVVKAQVPRPQHALPDPKPIGNLIPPAIREPGPDTSPCVNPELTYCGAFPGLVLTPGSRSESVCFVMTSAWVTVKNGCMHSES